MQPIDHAWALLKQDPRRLGANRPPRRRLGGISPLANAATRPPRRRLGADPAEDDEGLYLLGPQKGTAAYEARQMENANRPPQPPAPPREGAWGNDLMQQGRAGQMPQRRPLGTGPAPPPPPPPRPPPKPITGPPGTGIQTQIDDPRFAANAGYTSEFTLPTAEDMGQE